MKFVAPCYGHTPNEVDARTWCKICKKHFSNARYLRTHTENKHTKQNNVAEESGQKTACITAVEKYRNKQIFVLEELSKQTSSSLRQIHRSPPFRNEQMLGGPGQVDVNDINASKELVNKTVAGMEAVHTIPNGVADMSDKLDNGTRRSRKQTQPSSVSSSPLPEHARKNARSSQQTESLTTDDVEKYIETIDYYECSAYAYDFSTNEVQLIVGPTKTSSTVQVCCESPQTDPKTKQTEKTSADLPELNRQKGNFSSYFSLYNCKL